MASEASLKLDAVHEGIAHRISRRKANELTVAGPDPRLDAQGHVELACECKQADCERVVKVPLYVYRRLVETGDQYLLQAGHHAFASYRTIVSVGLMRIEERA